MTPLSSSFAKAPVRSPILRFFFSPIIAQAHTHTERMSVCVSVHLTNVHQLMYTTYGYSFTACPFTTLPLMNRIYASNTQLCTYVYVILIEKILHLVYGATQGSGQL